MTSSSEPPSSVSVCEFDLMPGFSGSAAASVAGTGDASAERGAESSGQGQGHAASCLARRPMYVALVNPAPPGLFHVCLGRYDPDGLWRETLTSQEAM